MSTFFKNLFDSESNIPIEKIFFSIFSIAMVRAFFDHFSTPDQSNFFFSWRWVYLQYPLFYISLFLSFCLILYLFSKKSFNRLVNFELKIFSLVTLKPLIDLIFTQGNGAYTSYLFLEPQNFFTAFLKSMNPTGYLGITLGISIISYILFILMSIFVYRETKNLFKAILTAIVSYVVLFIYAILPSIIALPMFFRDNMTSIAKAYHSTFEQSWIMLTSEQVINQLGIYRPQTLISILDNDPTNQIFFLLITIQIVIFSFIYKPAFSRIISKNLRPERIIFWFSIATIGIVINQKIFANLNILNAVNIITLLTFFMLIALNAWLAVCINDSEDIFIDKISNPERPLAKKNISPSEWKNFQLILFILVLFGIGIMNRAVGFLLVVAQMTYYAYSSKPLRLKSNFISSSFLIGLAALSIAMSGFYLVSPDQHISAFPIKAVFIIGISYAILSNFKDIKDHKGDGLENIKTIPVVFGLQYSKKIIALLYSIVIIGTTLFLRIYSLFILSIIVSLFLYYLFTKDKYQEKYIFLVFFIYLLALYLMTL